MLDITKIKQANTLYLGKKILYEEEMDSTQEKAKQLLKQEAKQNILIITDYQTQGKGTKGRIWYSTKEANITMTLLIYPDCTIEKLEGLTKEIAENIIDAMAEQYQIQLQRKEPNDILLHQKKVAGILTQTVSYQTQVQSLLIGIGFNVNEVSFPQEVKEIATSLKREYQKEFNREDIIILILEKLEKLLLKKRILNIKGVVR